MKSEFVQLKDDELYGVEGGIGVLEVIGILGGLYLGLREMVKEKGRQDAYDALGM